MTLAIRATAVANGALNALTYVRPHTVAAHPIASVSLYAAVLVLGVPLFVRLRRHNHLWKQHAARGNEPLDEPTVSVWLQWVTLGSVVYAFALMGWFVLTLERIPDAPSGSDMTPEYISYRAGIDRMFSGMCMMWALGLSWSYEVVLRRTRAFTEHLSSISVRQTPS